MGLSEYGEQLLREVCSALQAAGLDAFGTGDYDVDLLTSMSHRTWALAERSTRKAIGRLDFHASSAFGSRFFVLDSEGRCVAADGSRKTGWGSSKAAIRLAEPLDRKAVAEDIVRRATALLG